MRFILRITTDATAVAAAVAETAAAVEAADREFHNQPLAGMLDEASLEEVFEAYAALLPYPAAGHEPLAGYAGIRSVVLVVRTPDGCDIYYEGRALAFEASVQEACGASQAGSIPGLVEALRAAGLTTPGAVVEAALRYRGSTWANAACSNGDRRAEEYAAAMQAAEWACGGRLAELATRCWVARQVLPGTSSRQPARLRLARRTLASWPESARQALNHAIGRSAHEEWALLS